MIEGVFIMSTAGASQYGKGCKFGNNYGTGVSTPILGKKCCNWKSNEYYIKRKSTDIRKGHGYPIIYGSARISVFPCREMVPTSHQAEEPRYIKWGAEIREKFGSPFRSVAPQQGAFKNFPEPQPSSRDR